MRYERYGKDKLNEMLLGKTVLQHSVDVFKAVADKVIVVGRHVEGTIFAEGGETRLQSVYNGLLCVGDDGLVAIHDGARPFVTRQFVERLFDEAAKEGSAVPRLPLTDTLYWASLPYVSANREDYFCVQTPQVFDVFLLKSAYQTVLTKQTDFQRFTDDSSVFASCLNKPHFVDGQHGNIKLTYQDDLPLFRVGNGFDVHPFEEGCGVVLGGVNIPFDKKLKGHSDADVLCHALCDAVLSASGNKDIGHQFPDSDPVYKGIDSTILLARCVEIALQDGFEVVNVSATVICQEPKIAPHAEAMSQRIAQICKIAPNCVSISATTTERLGALGNGDGIAAEAVVLLRKFQF